jgi:hypothetical protein
MFGKNKNIKFVDNAQGKLMNDEFNIYFIEQRNQVLFKNKRNVDQSFLLKLDDLQAV